MAIWPYPAVVIGMPRHKVTWDDYRFFTRTLKAGDFLLMSSDPYFLSNRAISGTAFKHLAVYTGQVQARRDAKTDFIEKPKRHSGPTKRGVFERTVTHAISEGIQCQDFGEAFFHCDWVAAIRAWNTKEEQSAIVHAALSQVGLAYNFDFKPSGPPALYCTELGSYCLKAAGITPPEQVRINTYAAGLILPLDRFKTPVTLADFFAKYPMVASTISCDSNFARRSRIGEVMRVAFLNAPDAESDDGDA
jgi:hypothetical protein